MIKEFVKGKVAVFIDASNIFYSQRTLGWNIDYQRLYTYLKGECELANVTIYFGKKSGDKAQEKFLKILQAFGYEVKTREIKYIKSRDGQIKIKGNLDAEMIMDMIIRKDTFDTLLLFSGDSDFAIVLNHLKEEKKRVLVASVKGHVSRELLQEAKYINLKKLKDVLMRV